MKKSVVIIILLSLLFVPAYALAQDSGLDVNIGIIGNDPNVTVTSGDQSTYGIYSGSNSNFYLNGTDLNDLFTKMNTTSQSGGSTQGVFTQGDLSLPMPPPPAPTQTTFVTVPGANYNGEIQELYAIAAQATQEREILADALVKAIGITEELQLELDNLYASSALIVDPEAPATSPDGLSLDAMVALQADQLALLKLRLLINEIITLLLLLGAIIAVLRYRGSIFGSDLAGDSRVNRASTA